MTIKGTLDSLTKFAEKIDSILGKIKWLGIAATIILSCTHWKACNDRDEFKKKIEILNKKK